MVNASLKLLAYPENFAAVQVALRRTATDEYKALPGIFPLQEDTSD